MLSLSKLDQDWNSGCKTRIWQGGKNRSVNANYKFQEAGKQTKAKHRRTLKTRKEAEKSMRERDNTDTG